MSLRMIKFLKYFLKIFTSPWNRKRYGKDTTKNTYSSKVQQKTLINKISAIVVQDITGNIHQFCYTDIFQYCVFWDVLRCLVLLITFRDVFFVGVTKFWNVSQRYLLNYDFMTNNTANNTSKTLNVQNFSYSCTRFHWEYPSTCNWHWASLVTDVRPFFLLTSSGPRQKQRCSVAHTVSWKRQTGRQFRLQH